VRARLSGWKIFIVQYSIGNRQRRVSLGDVDELDNADIVVIGRDCSVVGNRYFARIASINPPTPSMRINRFML
jgi:hypothetical protein